MPRTKVTANRGSNKKKSVASGSKIAKFDQVMKKTAPADGGMKKLRRWRPGTVALREIKRYQKQTTLFLARAPFQRFVKSITEGIDPQFRF